MDSYNEQSTPITSMTSKTAYCPQCGKQIRQLGNFCENCGYKFAQKEVSVQQERFQQVENIVESHSSIDVPEMLSLMPGEKLLDKHSDGSRDFYVTNKRLIEYKSSISGTKIRDFHYRHIAGTSEATRLFIPLGFIGGIIFFLGIIFLVQDITGGYLGVVMIVVGVIACLVGFTYTSDKYIVKHMDGESMEIPNIKSESGQRVLDVLRTQLYNK